jgi:hypothetical protein
MKNMHPCTDDSVCIPGGHLNAAYCSETIHFMYIGNSRVWPIYERHGFVSHHVVRHYATQILTFVA